MSSIWTYKLTVLCLTPTKGRFHSRSGIIPHTGVGLNRDRQSLPYILIPMRSILGLREVVAFKRKFCSCMDKTVTASYEKQEKQTVGVYSFTNFRPRIEKDALFSSTAFRIFNISVVCTKGVRPKCNDGPVGSPVTHLWYPSQEPSHEFKENTERMKGFNCRPPFKAPVPFPRFCGHLR